MPLALTRILLITLALALNGQAFAAPCAQGSNGSSDHHGNTTAETGNHCAMEQGSHHCPDPAGQPHHTPGDTVESCEQACSCCPGHCASAVPGNEMQNATAHFASASTLYTEIQSTPYPETALRPPITA